MVCQVAYLHERFAKAIYIIDRARERRRSHAPLNNTIRPVFFAGVGPVGGIEILHEFSGEGLEALRKFK